MLKQPDCKITRAQQSDADALSEFTKAAFIETFRDQYSTTDIETLTDEMFNSKVLKEAIADTDRNVLLIAKNLQGEIVGMAHCQGHRSPVEGKISFANTFEIKRFYLHKSQFGTGLSHVLLKECLEHRNERKTWLGVFVKNYRAKAFYKKFNFEPIGEYKFSEKTLLDGSQDIDEIWLMNQPPLL